MSKTTTHFVTILSLEEAKSFLSDDHCIRRLEDCTTGLQRPNDYFIVSVEKFWGKKTVKEVIRGRLNVHEVLPDGSLHPLNQECYLYSTFCEEMEQAVKKWLGPKGDWDVEGNTGQVWLIVKQPYVRPYTAARSGWHQFGLVVAPECSPDCHLWVLVCSGTSAAPTPATLGTTSATLRTSKASALPPRAPLTPPKVNPAAEVISEAQKSTSTAPQTTSAAAVPQATTSAMSRTTTSGVAAKSTGSQQGAACRFSKTLVPLSSLQTKRRAMVIAVVEEVVKKGATTITNVKYDILKLVDESCADPSAPQTHYMLKVFHNDGPDWSEGGFPEAGSILLAKDVQSDLYNKKREAKVYSTKQIVKFEVSEDDQVTYHTGSTTFTLTENLKKAVLELHRWWQETGCKIDIWRYTAKVQPPTTSTLSHHTLADLKGGEGDRCRLYCQFLEKVVGFTASLNKSVLRVCDGTRTTQRFQKYDFEELENGIVSKEKSYSEVGSTEVDVLVLYSVVPDELYNLKSGDFILLDGVQFAGGDKLFLQVGDGNLVPLTKDDPQISVIQRALKSLAQGAAKDGASSTEGVVGSEGQLNVVREEKLAGEIHPELSSPSTLVSKVEKQSPCKRPAPSPSPSIPNDSFDSLLRCNTQEVIQRPQPTKSPGKRPQEDHNSTKRRRLDFNTEEPESGPLHSTLHTEVTEWYREVSLEAFYLRGEVGRVYSVEAVFKDLHFISSAECSMTECGPEHVCHHLWVWGICVRCNTTFSSHQLMLLNSTRTLNSGKPLPCEYCSFIHQNRHNCRLSSTPPPESPARSEEDWQGKEPSTPGMSTSKQCPDPCTVYPFMKLKVVLEDPASGLQLAFMLAGDSAEMFFGRQPHFGWIVGEWDVDVRRAAEALLHHPSNHTLRFGVMKQAGLRNTVQLSVVKTALHCPPPQTTCCS